MSPDQTLLISQVEKWNPAVLATDATGFGNLVTKGDQLLQSMLTTQDDLAESWKGAAADAAATRVVNEKTAGSHMMGKIDGLKNACTHYQVELTDARQQVIDKRTLIQGVGFEVADNGTVTADKKIQAIKAAGGRNPNNDADPGVVAGAILRIEHEAAQHQLAMVTALQHADNTAAAAKATIDVAKTEISRVSLLEAPSKAVRSMYPGLTHPDTAKPSELPPNWQLMGETMKLDKGVPLTVAEPDGSTKTITPNPDGTLTVASSVQQSDGSTITTTSTDGKPPTTTISTPRADGSGIVDVTATGPDGKTQRKQVVPLRDGRSTTYAVNDDGSQGRKLADSFPAPDGGVITNHFGEDGATDREWERPDGFRSFERFVSGPNGPELVGISNSAGLHAERLENGDIQTTFPDGRIAKTVSLPDGQILTRFPDGSVLGYDPGHAPEGIPKASPWDVVKSWGGGQIGEVKGAADGGWKEHPIQNVQGMFNDGGFEAVSRYGDTMAGRAASASDDSQLALQRMVTQLEAGDTAAGRSAVNAVNSLDEASRLGSHADALAKTGKIGGVLGSGAIATYTNVDDMVNHGKGIPEGIGNAVGSTAGSAAGGWAGAKAGAAMGAGVGMIFPASEPIAIPVGAVAGAIAGGYFGGTLGGHAGDKAGEAARDLFE